MGFWDRALSAPGAVLAGGLALWGMAWGIDAWTHIQVFGVAQGAHLHGGDAVVRLNMTITGLPLVAFGMAQLIGTDALLKRGGMPLFFASLFLMLDGLAHAFAFNDHLGEPPSAAFFAFVAPAQIAAGLALPFVSRPLGRLLLAGTLGLLALYAASRAITFEPLLWPERVEALDVVSKLFEGLFMIALVLNLKVARGREPKAVQGAAPAGPSTGPSP
ncbi:MAG TPA: hypothetical protein VJ547_08145 [Candidatus Thermoplasmatota archaeon]|nr:hypothetical protein [Candidatus Thermoplasmatota archaeon]